MKTEVSDGSIGIVSLTLGIFKFITDNHQQPTDGVGRFLVDVVDILSL